MNKFTTDSFRWVSDSSGDWLCVKCNRPQRILEEIKPGSQYDVEIKQHRERRSLDANAYMWVLLDRLADKLSCTGATLSKVDIYRDMIKNVPGVSETVCVMDSAVDTLRHGWEHNGLGWLTDTMPSKIEGCTNVILYSGSSTYDTKQMSRLIDLIIEECKLQGVEHMTPQELARLEGYE